jgi:hypothetical protein
MDENSNSRVLILSFHSNHFKLLIAATVAWNFGAVVLCQLPFFFLGGVLCPPSDHVFWSNLFNTCAVCSQTGEEDLI